MSTVKYVACMILVLLQAACTSQQVIDSTAAANTILDLRIQYDHAVDALESVIDGLPTEDGVELLELKERADAFVREATVAWEQSPTLALAALKAYYTRGRALYLDGYRIISRNFSALPPETVAALEELHAQAQAVDRQVRQLAAADEQRRQLIAAGLELATLALRLGVMVL